MAILAGRITPAEFRKRMVALSERHRRLVVAAMGNPPEINRISQKIWDQIKRENEAALLLLLRGAAVPTFSVAIGRLARSGHRPPLAAYQNEMDALAIERARWVADSITETTRFRLDADNGIQSAFGRQRWTDIATTETVAAQTIGTQAVASGATQDGIETTEVWFLGPCKHCDTCPLLHRTPRSVWGRWVSGTPLHPNCCCQIQVLFQPESELLASGMIRMAPPELESRITRFVNRRASSARR